MTPTPAPIDLATVVNLADFEAIGGRPNGQGSLRLHRRRRGRRADAGRQRRRVAQWRLRPRVLVDVSSIDTSTTWLGTRVAFPVGIAPMAFQHFAHPDAELATARAAAAAGVVFCLSTLSSRTIEEVARRRGRRPRWFQLYVHRDRGVSAELVARAEAAGYSALGRDRRPAHRRPARARLPQRLALSAGLRQLRSAPPAAGATGEGASLGAVIGGFNDASLSWADVAWLRGLSTMPLVLKGILTAEDAALAVEHGAAGDRRLEPRRPPARSNAGDDRRPARDRRRGRAIAPRSTSTPASGVASTC